MPELAYPEWTLPTPIALAPAFAGLPLIEASPFIVLPKL